MSETDVKVDVRIELPPPDARPKPVELAVLILEALLKAVASPGVPWWEALGMGGAPQFYLRMAADRVLGRSHETIKYTNLADMVSTLREAGFYVERNQAEAVAERQQVIDSLQSLRRIDAEKILNARQARDVAVEELSILNRRFSEDTSNVDALLQEDADIIHALVDERVQARADFEAIGRVFVRKSERQKERDDSKGAGEEDKLTDYERRVVGALTTNSQYDWEIAQQTTLGLGLVRETLKGAALCGAATKTWEGMWVLPGPDAYATTRRYPCAR